jgi:hypothetical protein
VKTTGVVNQFYVYAVDGDFGPFLLKFCSYFPYNAKLCINGHEWATRQATKPASPTPRWTTGLLPARTRVEASASHGEAGQVPHPDVTALTQPKQAADPSELSHSTINHDSTAGAPAYPRLRKHREDSRG